MDLQILDGVPAAATLTELTGVFASNVAFHRLSGDFPDAEDVRPDQVAAAVEAELTNPSAEILLLREAPDGLVGVAFLLHEHPDPADTYPWIGLLLIHDGRQGHGYGRRAVDLVEERFRVAGRAGVRLAVLENNPNALGFWTALGYRELDRRTDRGHDRACVVLQKDFPTD